MCVWPEEVVFGTSYKVTIHPKFGVCFLVGGVGLSGGGSKVVIYTWKLQYCFSIILQWNGFDWKLLYAIVISQAREQ